MTILEKKYDLRTTEGKKAAEDDQVYRNERKYLSSQLKYKLAWPILILGSFIFYLVSALHDDSLVTTFQGLNRWYEWVVFGFIVLIIGRQFVRSAGFYSSQGIRGRIATLTILALAGGILFWLLKVWTSGFVNF